MSNFLSYLAEDNVCIIKCGLTPETLKVLTKFIEFIHEDKELPEWLENFKRFCESGK